ncbi:MAG: BTAD domain-containing putative transcriptional regulator [Gemmatimonadota bacterium]
MQPLLHLQSLGDLRLRGPAGDLLPRRRKELALLVVLAARAPRAMRREEMQALLWGERDEQRARHSLRQTLLRLRRACGEDVLEIAPDTLRLKNDRIVLDAREFAAAAAARRFAEAIELWNGDFMVGCEDVGGEEFATWFEAERARLRQLLYSCFDCLVSELESAQEWSEMARWAARWTEQFAVDEHAAIRHVDALCQAGQPAAATAAQAAFIRGLSRELEEAPSAGWLDRTNRVIAETPPPSVPARIDAAVEAGSLVPRTRKRTRRIAVATAASVAVVATAAWTVDLLDFRDDRDLVLAVGHIETLGLPDSAAALPSLLAIHLGRAAGLSILSEGRIQEVRVQMGSRGNVAADLQRAAQAAGADEIIEGVLARRSDGTLRLDLRRIDLDRHTARATYSVEAADLYGIVDNAAERIARDLGVALAPDHLPGGRSLNAVRLYEEGLLAFYSGEERTAERFLRAALTEDSTFAMAAYYAARINGVSDRSALLHQARRMSQRGPDRERLFIEAHWLGARDEPSQLAVAETLAIRYPTEPGGHFEYARALIRSGRFIDAIPQYRQVVQLDSLGLRGDHARCLACDGYYGMLDAYRLADSMAASERVAREWIAQQPRSAGAWASLSHIRKVQGRYREAIQDMTKAARYDRTNSIAVGGMMDLWLRMGDFESADRFWSGLLATPGHDLQSNALADAVSSLRTQGRLIEALDAALQVRAVATERNLPLGDAFTHATVLFDLGRYHESAALFDSLSRADPADSPARQGRNRAWFLTHAATAVAALRDTTRLRKLEDTIRVRGSHSGFRRDQLLHHYARGLRLRLQGRPTEAVTEFRRSLYSPVEGNTRASIELARTLIDLGRSAEATRVLRSAHWGPIGASGQYVNRTELELLLARAFEASGQRDSAAAHYEWVLKAWKSVDAPLYNQRVEIRERARKLANR